MPENSQHWIAVVGRQDKPTDALEDYCRLLAQALNEKGCSMQLIRVAWDRTGWHRALSDLSRTAAEMQGGWALVQYTALSWSKRGFPFGFVRLIRRLKGAGMNVAIVFHDPFPFPGRRLRDRLRRRAQLAVMLRSARIADKIVSTISPDCVPWMHADSIRAKTRLLVVGSNLSAPRGVRWINQVPTVVVFGVTEHHREEAILIAKVMSRASEQVGPMRLVVFGRGAPFAEAVLAESLQGSPVQLEVMGLLEADEASALLANSDVQLFVRSGVSSRRGSAIAGIVCGLPIVGFVGAETAFPITEAGVRLAPSRDVDGLSGELISVLQDNSLRESLRSASQTAARQYFSWDAIADGYLSFLRPDCPTD